MRKLGLALAAAALIGMGLSAVPAEARNWQHGHYNHHGHYHGKHHRDNGARIALGIIGGALAGAAIASQAQPYYYSYSYPYYGYAYPY
jgi:hypothetical protein